MKERIILTLEEAHMIQAWEAEAKANKEPFVLPSPYKELWDLEVPEEADNIPDMERMTAAYGMLMRGSTIEQVVMQMNWKANSQPPRQLAGMMKRIKKGK
ncbi:hypothetical protein MOP88_07350 [Sphingomonas sp. WKB10]|nr:hypothetical protein [Sphingomonas sp. WKB10]